MINAIIKGVLTTALLIAVLSGLAYIAQHFVRMLQRIDPTIKMDDVVGLGFGMILITAIFTSAWYIKAEA